MNKPRILFLGKSIPEYAKGAGCAVMTVHRVLNGEVDPKYKNARGMARVAGLSTDAFMAEVRARIEG